MTDSTTKKLFAEQNKLRLSLQGMKTQHGYSRRHITHIERILSRERKRRRNENFALLCIVLPPLVFLITYAIGQHLR